MVARVVALYTRCCVVGLVSLCVTRPVGYMLSDADGFWLLLSATLVLMLLRRCLKPKPGVEKESHLRE